jgi:DNA-binding NarL/FixJ family response regulator
MPVIRVLLANQHPIIRANLRLVLDRDRACRVIGEAANGREVVLACSYQKPDVVVLDFNLPFLSGLEAAKDIAAGNLGTRSLFISGRSEEEYVSNAFQAGGRGFVLSDAIQEELAVAVKAVAKGNHFLSPRVLESWLSESHLQASDENSLDEAEKRVLLLLATGADPADAVSGLKLPNDGFEASLRTLRRKGLRAGIPAQLLELIGTSAVR